MNNEWKSIINHSNASDDWFIINRQQYGSLRYLQRKLIIIVTCIAILVVISWILYWESLESNGVLVWLNYILLVFGPPTLVLFYVAYKLPQFRIKMCKDAYSYILNIFCIYIYIVMMII